MDVFFTLRTLNDNAFDWSVEVVKDGRQALDRLQDEQAQLPAAVVLDLYLPLVSGQELLRHLRASPRTRTLPVIVMQSSENELRHLEPSLLSDSHLVCLVKPLDFPAFETALAFLGVNGDQAHWP